MRIDRKGFEMVSSAGFEKLFVKPLHVEFPLAQVELKFDGLDLWQDASLDVAFATTSKFVRSLNGCTSSGFFRSSQDHREFSFACKENTYLVSGLKIRPEAIEFSQGSIRTIMPLLIVGVAGLYNGVASYPDFKDGYQVLKQDFSLAVQKISSQLVRETLAEAVNEDRQTDEDGSPLPNEGTGISVSVHMIREEEFLAGLQAAIRDSTPGDN